MKNCFGCRRFGGIFIGVCGWFSADGHLAASLGVMWNLPAVYDVIDMPYRYNKPKGVMLIYPVITGMEDKKTPHGSFVNLLETENPTEEQLAACSIERHVHPEISPAYIVHTANEGLVPVQNLLLLADAYGRCGDSV